MPATEDHREPNPPTDVRFGWRLGRYALLWLVLLLAIHSVVVPFAYSRWGDVFCAVEARHCAIIGRLFGLEASTTGSVVSTSEYYIRVEPVCTGVDYLLYLGALALFFPAPWRLRLSAAVGLPLAFYAILIGRLCFLLQVGRFRPDWVLFLHETWKIGFVVVFCALWGLYLTRLLSRPRDGGWPGGTTAVADA